MKPLDLQSASLYPRIFEKAYIEHIVLEVLIQFKFAIEIFL